MVLGMRRWAGLRIEGRQGMMSFLGFATWLPVLAWFNIHVAETTVVNGASMYPFLNEDRNTTLRRDLVLTWKWSPQENLQRGMVVTLRSPTNPDVVAVKRIVAMEGDTIRTKAPYPSDEVTVPWGHVWVEGDGDSRDSNTYGSVSMRLLTGKVTHVLFPLRKFGEIRWWEHRRPLNAGRE